MKLGWKNNFVKGDFVEIGVSQAQGKESKIITGPVGLSLKSTAYSVHRLLYEQTDLTTFEPI